MTNDELRELLRSDMQHIVAEQAKRNQRQSELFTIVRELAETDGFIPMPQIGFMCPNCFKYSPFGWSALQPFPHSSDCLWLRAQPFKEKE
jgi:hypothetical protein